MFEIKIENLLISNTEFYYTGSTHFTRDHARVGEGFSEVQNKHCIITSRDAASLRIL